MKKIIKNLMLIMTMLVIGLTLSVTASALDETGQCGENVYWSYSVSSKELTISGEGGTWDYDGEDDLYSPFHDADIDCLVICDGVTRIGNEMFSSSSVRNIVFPETLISIGDAAFNCCKNLEAINLNDGLKAIGVAAFSECVNAAGSLIIPDSVVSMKNCAFQHCRSLTNLYIGKGLTFVAPYAFQMCSGLKNIVINPELKCTDFWSFFGVEPEHTYFTAPEDEFNIEKIDDRFIGDTVHYNYGFKNNHFCIYTEEIFEPTCQKQGYSNYVCECGYSYQSNYADKLDHSYESEITTSATHLTEGVETFTCKCGDTYTQTIAKLEGHTYTSEITTAATHLTEGIETFICECGDTYTNSVAKLEGHTYVAEVIAPTCTEKGYTIYTCECGEMYISDYVAETNHNYGDNEICRDCGVDRTANCSCNCHNTGFMGFIWKIINFFNKLFKSNRICACGVSHY